MAWTNHTSPDWVEWSKEAVISSSSWSEHEPEWFKTPWRADYQPWLDTGTPWYDAKPDTLPWTPRT